jgi:hypothetical protein
MGKIIVLSMLIASWRSWGGLSRGISRRSEGPNDTEKLPKGNETAAGDKSPGS